MNINIVDPLSDQRWHELATSHPRATVFHQRGWLDALARTYGYQPFVLTHSAAGAALRDGIVLCRVASWITGERAVSLPFADHCEPLLNETADRVEFAEWLRSECDRQGWRYVELRPRYVDDYEKCLLWPRGSYWLHTLDLTPSLEQIFQGLHKDSMQRRIRRAERERLSYRTGLSVQLLDEFYRLQLVTRKRHRLFPQPRTWFSNLAASFGEKMQIRVAARDGVAIAALLTLRHGSTIVYKYGCSDERYHNFAGIPFLFWRLIEESKNAGATEIDLGRSDLYHKGLITFKERLGARRQSLRYLRYPERQPPDRDKSSSAAVMRKILARLPNAILPGAGKLLYRHLG